MTHPTEPPVTPPVDDSATYTVAADEYAASSHDESDEDGEGDSESGQGESGGKGLKSSKDYDVVLESFLDFSDDQSLSIDENEKAKLDKLSIAPMSFLASGASAFASENDLSRKVFMARVGLVNFEIAPRDIASPELIKLLNDKHIERRRIFGIKTLDEIVSGAIGAAGMMVGAVTSSVSDYVKDKREEKRIERQIKNYESGKEEYALDSDDEAESVFSLQQADFPVQEIDQDDPVLNYLRDVQDRHNSFKEDVDASPLMRLFNALATVVAPEQVKSIKIDTDILNIGHDIPDIFQDLNPVK